MPIQTQTVTLRTIDTAEVIRANEALNSVANLTQDVAAKSATIAAQAAEIERLKGLVTPPPPVVIPPPVPVRGDFRVDGRLMRDPSGAIWSPRGIEMLWGPDSAREPLKAVTAARQLGANMIAPIFQRAQSSLQNVLDCFKAATALAMGVAVNADASGVDRAWLKRQDIVKACNENACVAMLECEVELGSKASMSATQWRDLAIAFVKDLRVAGHTKPIRVGSPSGGRYTKYARQMGSAVLAADPLRNCVFTWQAYIDADPSGNWQYQDDEGVSRGTVGALELAAALRDSGLCWLVGLDGADDIGPTPYVELANALHGYGIGWQWWALFVGDAYGNGLLSDALDASSLKGPFGATVRALLKAQAVLPRLT
jgi:hypothetical protein